MAYSFVEYTGDGDATDFNVNISYLARNHITVLVDGESVSFTWLSPTMVRLDEAPVLDAAIKVKRTTPYNTRIVNFTNGSILNAEENLDADSDQLLFIEQELIEGEHEVLPGSIGSTELADTAVTPGSYVAASITVDQDGRITAAASTTPFDASDAVDAVGAALADTSTVTLTDTAGTITADVVGKSIGPAQLEDTAVTPGAYPTASITVDAQGRVTAAAAGTLPTTLPPTGAAGGDLSGTYPNPSVDYAATAGVAATAGAATFATTAGGAPPTGTAGGDLSGTYPNPGVAKVAGVTPGAGGLSILDDVNAAAMRTTLGLAAVAASGAAADVSGLATVATSGSASDLGSGTLPLARLVNITDTQIAAANKDGVAGTASLRTLGTGAAQAAAGNDSRLSDSRAPNGAATGDLTGTYPAPTIATAAVTNAKMANMADSTMKGRAVGAGSGVPTDLTAAQSGAIARSGMLLNIVRNAVTLTGTTPYCLQYVSALDKYLYIDNSAGGKVYEIDPLTDMIFARTVATAGTPYAMVYAATSNRIWVAGVSPTLQSFNPSTWVLDATGTATRVEYLLYNTTDLKLYGFDNGTPSIKSFNATTGVIGNTDNAPTNIASQSASPWIYNAPNNSIYYIDQAGAVRRFNCGTRAYTSLGTIITGGSTRGGICLASDGMIYVMYVSATTASDKYKMKVIDPTSDTVIATVDLSGDLTTSVSGFNWIYEWQGYLYAGSNGSSPHGIVVVVKTSSRALVGSIVVPSVALTNNMAGGSGSRAYIAGGASPNFSSMYTIER